jgi:hypothetical protein
LREQLGWDGVVVTDDLQAGALRDSYATADITRLPWQPAMTCSSSPTCSYTNQPWPKRRSTKSSG